jgi:hypothetical protein
MLGSDILEVAIGVTFVFLLVSLIASAVREGIESRLKSRAAYLEHGIRELLRDRAGHGLARMLYEHPLISGLYHGDYVPGEQTEEPAKLASGHGLPSYIPTRNVALALMDLAARGPVESYTSGAGATPVTAQNIRANIQNIGNPAIQRVLLTALDTAGDDLDRARREVEAWYDSAMDRVSGWYKRSTQLILFFIGIGVAVALNVDAVYISNYLYQHPAARTAVVARAEAAARDSGTAHLNYPQARAALDSLDLPIGWSDVEFRWPWKKYPEMVKDSTGKEHLVVKRPNVLKMAWGYALSPLLGWLITGFAATFGAPFWFDVLNKFMVIRSTVKPHEKSKEEGSEDRQPKPDRTAAREPAEAPSEGGVPPGGGAGGGGAGGGGAPPGGGAGAGGTAPDPLAVAEANLEGGHVPGDDATPDEDLPQAEGGVG